MIFPKKQKKKRNHIFDKKKSKTRPFQRNPMKNPKSTTHSKNPMKLRQYKDKTFPLATNIQNTQQNMIFMSKTKFTYNMIPNRYLFLFLETILSLSVCRRREANTA